MSKLELRVKYLESLIDSLPTKEELDKIVEEKGIRNYPEWFKLGYLEGSIEDIKRRRK